MRARRDGLPTAFIDLVSQIAIGFMVLFALAVLFMGAKRKEDEGKIIPKAEFMVTMDWDEGSEEDIDLYVKGPTDKIVFFGNLRNALMFLDQDNTGRNNTLFFPGGDSKVMTDRREIVISNDSVPMSK
jgi:hypothetical protein